MKTISRISHRALLAFVAAVPVAVQAAGPPPAPIPAPAPAPAQTAPTPNAVVVNLRDIDIADVAQQVSRITGRTIILDPAVKGTVNVVSSRPLGPDGVWQLFQSVLRGQGFAVVRNGRAWRVIAQADAARQPANGSAGGQMITRMIRLDKVSPEAAARVLKPLVASFGSLEMTTNPNAIIVTDYADNVARIEGLAHALDHSQGTGFDTITLHYATAKDVAAAIQGIVGEGDNAVPHAVADGRSNTVLVRGDSSTLAKARDIARQLDRPGGSAAITTRVFRLHYNDAESLTAVMRGLMGGQASAQNPVARTLATGAGIGGAFGGSGLGGSTGGLSGLSGSGLLGTGSGLGTSSGLGQASGVSGMGSASGMNPLPVTGSSSTAKSGEGGFATDDLAVEPDKELNAIVVRGRASAIASIESLITQLDVRRPQVLIEAAIVEINGDWSEQLGVQMGFGAAAAGATNGAGTSFSNTGVSLGQILSFVGAPAATAFATDGLTGTFGKTGSFQVIVQALAKSTRANLLSTPTITTLDNQPAEIVVGQNVPFITGSYTTAGTTTPFTTVERADVGITLRVVPRIHDGDTVQLDVSQEASSLAPSVTGAADLITNRRSITTTVLADDGQTIVLGGLISNNNTRSVSQVPVLGSIPIIGNLFKSRVEQKQRQTLFVFLKPTVLRDAASVSAAAAEKYERVRNAQKEMQNQPSLLLEPPAAHLPIEINGIY
ncbi:type II secretion system secretin GspD [Novosphingobium sp.]|uniref:type II secretion system secretin GspD n=1 Tax=Novosphingobium sp. TaxID=1874826 RepID=UPI003D0C3CC3